MDLRDAIADAARDGRSLEARAGGSKRDIGAAGRATTLLDLSAFDGVIEYEPCELVLTVRPSTPLEAVEALLAHHGQMLAFEPWDHGSLFGRAKGAATIGGVVAAGVAGSRRVSSGGARDHLLGFEAVSGRGEVFRGGGKVVKNVTGYDISKVVAGSWGQLVVLTELSLKVVPSPRAAKTVWLQGLGPAGAIAAMAKAMGSSCAVAAAGHLPGYAGIASITAFRLEGFAKSVEVRTKHLQGELSDFGAAAVMSDEGAGRLWHCIVQAGTMKECETLWRVNLVPSRAEEFISAIEGPDTEWSLDWAGAAAWVGAPAICDVRFAAESSGGHAMLLRAPDSVHKKTAIRHPQSAAVAALTARLKQAFDPAGILDPHRFS